MKQLIMVFLGGGSGSVLRYLIGWSFKKMGPTWAFPVHTLASNVLACLIFALVLVLSKNKGTESHALLLAGFCGGLSTFSSFSYETNQLMGTQPALALLNIGVSVALCLLIFWWIR